ncbi:hypothetical protein SPRG_03654 [Saprolegnia parasitica CBS 223.65]|uniref:Uncharacterized protein n=1 Tax=Saprolegnia parasitica (strain CBS 223.65) TaxID=695850 RepID=A0A067CM38_SAPPC|nr:hypothetical protein SPRG_03654 [Saprolegnia parasitica CBS 223.65]KDO31734.1 hypothetical protein SPRG_03654 [Saprolegnia parasitica CBS 223.65]|eukprot:XP_012197615.1 hypothetical protein SPRG_03654 [Saprolegnia parasitica CBS 223.65]
MAATETVMEVRETSPVYGSMGKVGEAPKSSMRHLTYATAATPSMVDGAWKDGMDKFDDERNVVMEEAVGADIAFKENNTPLKSSVNQSKGKKRAAAAPSPSSATKKGRSAIKVQTQFFQARSAGPEMLHAVGRQR